ncbi:MAG: hypothetical protein N3F08_00390 [Crenarchaeota archaeon]|nr:hypothetical protein [Thermoproteota archaeon]
MIFKKDEVIAIIEMKSSVTGTSPEDLCKEAIGEKGLKRYVKEYKDKYGIAIGFSYDPEAILAVEPGMIKIEIVEMSELK